MPCPDMVDYSEFTQGTVPDMYLYNSDNCHYDLLVEESSRLAVFGLIDMGTVKKSKELEDKEKEDRSNKEENGGWNKSEGKGDGNWKTVKGH